MSASAPQGPRKSSTGRKCLKIGLRGLITACTVVPVVYSVLADWPVGPIAEKLLGVLALGLLSFHVVNTKTRVRLGHWRVELLRSKLRRELCFGWVMPIGIMLAAVALPPSWETLLGMGMVFGVSWVFYQPLQEKIRKIVDDEGLEQGTERFKRRQPFKWLLDIEDDVGQIADEEHGPGLQTLLGSLVKQPWQPGVSRTRTLILHTMLFGLLLAWGASAQIGAKKIFDPPPPITKGRSNSNPQPSPGGKGTNPTEGSEPKPSPEDEQTCLFPPSRGAPAWAEGELNALYYGGMALNANPPPGNIGGCTKRAVVIPTPFGDFVYTIGRVRNNEVRSIAVTSRRFGAAIFLAPAAQRVIELIRRGVVPLGGYPTMETANGDTTAITTPQGTFILIRKTKHPLGMPDFATPYLELSPMVSSAWFGAVREHGSWLWPQARQGESDLEFLLTADSSGRESKYIITYDPSSGTAQRDQYQYELPEPQLEQAELERYAATAR